MLKKRIIPCLDIKGERTVKGIRFQDLQDSGDPVELAQRYARQGADELVLLDITATNEERSTFLKVVEGVAREVNIPFTVGGGIREVGHVEALLNAGADKVSVNSAAVKRPELVSELAERFGTQCIVVAIDAAREHGKWLVCTNAGQRKTEREAVEWAEEAVSRGAGEILLTSMEHDGTRNGFALELTQAVAEKVSVPVIASGGAGEPQHFMELFQQTEAGAALAAGIFHTERVAIPTLKSYLNQENISIRC